MAHPVSTDTSDRGRMPRRWPVLAAALVVVAIVVAVALVARRSSQP